MSGIQRYTIYNYYNRNQEKETNSSKNSRRRDGLNIEIVEYAIRKFKLKRDIKFKRHPKRIGKQS